MMVEGELRPRLDHHTAEHKGATRSAYHLARLRQRRPDRGRCHLALTEGCGQQRSERKAGDEGDGEEETGSRCLRHGRRQASWPTGRARDAGWLLA